jgi:hypothetical protein
VAFVLLVTANGAGYRYGVSDQAAYVPLVVRAGNAAAFPRDAPLLDTQGRLFVIDQILAGVGAVTGASTESLFFGAYLISLVLVFAGIISIGTALYPSWWLTATLGALVTLRHHIPRTSVNSVEPYFHPRVMALGLGLLAVGAFLRGRAWRAVMFVAIAAVCHLTTALWLTLMIGTGLATLDSRWRRAVFVGALAAAGVLAWMATTGPLHAASPMMDAVWQEGLGNRNFLFANEWPFWAWMANLGLLGALWWAQTARARHGLATPRDAALAWGATALVALFLITLPFVAARMALAAQFQISRVFWLVDTLLAVYGVAAIGERLTRRGMATFAMIVLLGSTARAVYIVGHEHAERSLFQLALPESPWLDAMRWIAQQPLDAFVLADPGHAFKYGASVRVAAERDVLLEDDKDSSMALYSRDIAVRVVERRKALDGFESLTVDRVRALASRYGLTLLVTDTALDLPEVYRNARFRIYALKPAGPAS